MRKRKAGCESDWLFCVTSDINTDDRPLRRTLQLQ